MLTSLHWSNWNEEALLRIDLEWEFVGVDGGGCDCRAKGKGATTEPLNKVEKRYKTNLTHIRTLPLKWRLPPTYHSLYWPQQWLLLQTQLCNRRYNLVRCKNWDYLFYHYFPFFQSCIPAHCKSWDFFLNIIIWFTGA